MLYVLIELEHIASYQHEILTKNEFLVLAFAFPVRKQLTKKGPDRSPLEDPEMQAWSDEDG